MPSHLLINPRQLLAAPSRSQRPSLPRLGALLVLLAACGSSTDVPNEDTQASKSAPSGATAGAAASPPTAADTKTASGQMKAPASSTPAASGSASPANPATPNASNASPMAMAMPAAKDPTPAKDPVVVPDPKDPASMTTTDPVKLPDDVGTPTLFWLDIASGIVTKSGADGAGAMVVASGSPLSAPDGVTIDPEGKHFFVLNMGTVIGGGNSGSLVRYDLDGSNPMVIMKPGAKAGDVTFNTGKQVTIDRVNHKLYLGDREGSKVWRCDYDGGNLEVLVSGHGVMQIVGVGADPTKNQFYFSDRNGKKLFRAGMDMPAGETAMDRTDVKTVASNLTQAIGLAFDHKEGMLYVTSSGTVSMVKADGTGLKAIGSSGSTGISFARIP